MKHGIVFCCAVFAAFSAAAQAVPLIYDGFNYPLGEPLAGQQSPDVGWAGAWDVNSATANAVVVAGLTFAGPRYDLFVSGNAVKLSAWQSESLASRGVSASVVGGDLWTGWLVNVDGVIAGNRVVESRVNLFEFGDFRASKLRTLIKSFFGTGPAVAYGIHEALGTPDTTQPNTTYLLVSHFEDVNQYQGGPATLWMVSLADFSAMDLADGVMSVADLEAHHSCKVVCDHENEALNVGDFIQLELFSDINATFDELRYGTTLADVVPLVAHTTAHNVHAVGGRIHLGAGSPAVRPSPD